MIRVWVRERYLSAAAPISSILYFSGLLGVSFGSSWDLYAAQRQCLYFCTSQASKLSSTSHLGASARSISVSMCTFVPVQRVNPKFYLGASWAATAVRAATAALLAAAAAAAALSAAAFAASSLPELCLENTSCEASTQCLCEGGREGGRESSSRPRSRGLLA